MKYRSKTKAVKILSASVNTSSVNNYKSVTMPCAPWDKPEPRKSASNDSDHPETNDGVVRAKNGGV